MDLAQTETRGVRKRLQVAVISSVLPRQCGIATFSNHISRGLRQILGREATSYLALNDNEEYDYIENVIFEIKQDRLEDYRAAARAINESSVDVVSLQHEFGLFGGEDGQYVVEFLSLVEKPVVTTLHTVLEKPSPGEYKTLVEVAAFSKAIIVMNQLAIRILTDVYDIPEFKIRLIPHGVADKFYIDPLYYKHKLDLTDRFVVLTFGFLSRNKGIEVVLKALAEIADKHPNLLYIIQGVTHPVVKKADGEEYREYLKKIVQENHLDNQVVFVDRFLDDETLDLYLGAADLVICPYHSEAQVTSGVLSLSLGKGKAVLSTPYLHARDALADGKGRLVHFKDHLKMAEAIDDLIDNQEERLSMAGKAFIAGQKMGWDTVARQYIDVFEDVIAKADADKLKQGRVFTLPDINMDYLKELTDETGIIQHTLYSIPDYTYDYSSDDAGRAIVAFAQYYNLFRDESALRFIDKYMAFIVHARRKDGWFYNYVNYQKEFPEQSLSEDTFGRCLWGLGAATRLVQNRSPGLLARNMVEESLPLVKKLSHPRAQAYAACGLASYLILHKDYKPARKGLEYLADSLVDRFHQNKDGDWIWYDDMLTYDNARLPQALLLAYRHLKVPEYLEVGLKTLDFLIKEQYKDGYIDIIGNQGWYKKNGLKAIYCQQPLDAGSLTETCILAMALTGNQEYLDMAYTTFQWFLGRNRQGKTLYNSGIGACADGLAPDGPSRNRGAESTIAFVLALVSLYRWEMISKFYYKDRAEECSEL